MHTRLHSMEHVDQYKEYPKNSFLKYFSILQSQQNKRKRKNKKQNKRQKKIERTFKIKFIVVLL